MKKSLFTFYSFILIIISCFVLPGFIKASGASLYLSPASGSFLVGSTFNVSILTNTGDNNINAVKANLKFDPKKLQIASPTAGKSFISVWIAQPGYSNILGTANFQGGVPSPGINTSAGLVSTITFRVVAPGITTVSLLDSSQVLLNDGQGTDILTSLGKGVYNLNLAPPEGPEVFSLTHPDQNKWYRNNNVSFAWQKENRVDDFSYSLDNDFYGIPDDIPEGGATSVSYSDVQDGVWYFHVKAKKGDVWGGVSHYLVQIDQTMPAKFSLVFEPSLANNLVAKEPIVSFITTDSLSGIDHFEIKTIDLKNKSDQDTGFFVEVDSPYRLPLTEYGDYLVVVRVYDKAMNWRDISQEIEVAPINKVFYLSLKGISFFGLFLSWFELLIPLLLIIVFIIYWRWRKHNQIKQKQIKMRELNNTNAK